MKPINITCPAQPSNASLNTNAVHCETYPTDMRHFETENMPAEVQPPSHVWEKISFILDQQDVQKKHSTGYTLQTRR